MNSVSPAFLRQSFPTPNVVVPADDPNADESHDDAKSRKRHQRIRFGHRTPQHEPLPFGQLLSSHQKNYQLGGVGGSIRNERCGSLAIDIGILA